MSHPDTSTVAAEPSPLCLVAVTWFACGVVLYGLIPLPLRDATLGWSAAFWLLAAPLLLLAAKYVLLRQPSTSTRRAQPAPRRTGGQARRRQGASATPAHRKHNPSHRIAA